MPRPAEQGSLTAVSLGEADWPRYPCVPRGFLFPAASVPATFSSVPRKDRWSSPARAGPRINRLIEGALPPRRRWGPKPSKNLQGTSQRH
jgi:hypothetical protein